jgi:hypothetical protein
VKEFFYDWAFMFASNVVEVWLRVVVREGSLL